MVYRVKERGGDVGFNAISGVSEDLAAAGMSDPTMVSRSAQEKAASRGFPILTTEVVVAEVPPEGGAAAVSRAGHNMNFM